MVSGFFSALHYAKAIWQKRTSRNKAITESNDLLDESMNLTYLLAGLIMGVSAAYSFIVDNQSILIWGFLLFIVHSVLYMIGKSMSDKQKNETSFNE